MLDKIRNLLLIDIQEAISELQDACKKHYPVYSDESTILGARFNELNSNIRKGVLGYDESNRERNKIVDGLLALINTIESESRVKNATNLPQNLTPSIVLNLPPEFIGIDDDVNFIDSYYKSNSEKKPLVIKGIGGIGKTTIAQYFYIQNKSKYRHYIWINYRDSLFSSFVENENQHLLKTLEISPLTDRSKIENKFFEVINKIKTIENGLIVIDGLDQYLLDEETKILLSLQQNYSWDVLLTSRFDLHRFTIWGISLPKPEEAINLYWLYYNESTPIISEQPSVNDLITYVGYHPLMIELIAKTIKNSFRLTPQKVLNTLKNWQVQTLKTAIAPNRSAENISASEHLKVIFNISILNETQKNLLLQIAILGNNPTTFEDLVYGLKISSLVDEEHLDAQLTQLVEQGWIEKQSNRIIIHQVIREVIREQIPLHNGAECSQLLKSFGEDLFYEFRKNQYLWYEMIKYKRHLHSIVEFIQNTVVNHHYALLLDNLAWLCYNLEKDIGISYKIQVQAVEICEIVLSKDHLHLAKAYNLLSMIYSKKGDNDMYINLQEKSMNIREKYPDHQDYAEALGHKAVILMQEEKYNKAINYMYKEISILEKTYQKHDPIFFFPFLNLSVGYLYIQNYEQSLWC